jgi:hypothetical protein
MFFLCFIFNKESKGGSGTNLGIREAAHTRICERARHRQNQDTVPKELRSAPAAEETEESSCWFESVELRKMGMDAGDSPSRITVGVCVMQKKVSCRMI